MAPTNMSIQPGDRPAMKQEDHPAHNMPSSDYNGDVLRSEGTARLRTQFEQEDSKAWQDAAGRDSQRIETLVRGRDD